MNQHSSCCIDSNVQFLKRSKFFGKSFYRALKSIQTFVPCAETMERVEHQWWEPHNRRIQRNAPGKVQFLSIFERLYIIIRIKHSNDYSIFDLFENPDFRIIRLFELFEKANFRIIRIFDLFEKPKFRIIRLFELFEIFSKFPMYTLQPPRQLVREIAQMHRVSAANSLVGNDFQVQILT